MRREGFALVFALLAIAAVELLTVASLVLATHESLVADTRQRTIIATRAADAALSSLERAWPVPGADSLRVDQSIMLSSADQVSVEIARSAWGLFHVVATANAGRVSIRRAAVLRQLDLARGLAESNEAMVAAGPVVAPLARFSVSNERACALPVVVEASPAAVTLSSWRHALGISDVRIDSAHAILPPGYAAAGLRWEEVATIADLHASASIQLTAADSTGALLYPLIYANDDLTIIAGSGQGLIFVRGNLQMESGVQFAGVIVVQGTVTVGDDVHITGTLRVQGKALSSIGRATFTHSTCDIAFALRETPAAARLIRSSRTRIPAF
jgi:hypothetical protein